MPEITWDLFNRQVEACTLCSLCQNIHHKVPGQGDPHSPLMLIGEGPGQDEDLQGLAFVGAAGQLLTKMLAAIRLPSRASADLSVCAEYVAMNPPGTCIKYIKKI